jgi:hypothetical protein
MPNNPIQRAHWDQFFAAKNRIEVDFVPDHPDYPAHDHEFVEIQLIVAGHFQQRSSMGESRPSSGARTCRSAKSVRWSAGLIPITSAGVSVRSSASRPPITGSGSRQSAGRSRLDWVCPISA